MARRRPITQRFHGHWIFRGSVWDPQLFLGKVEYFRLTVETVLPPELGRFLQVVFFHGKFLDEKLLRRLERITKELERRNKRHGIVADVMES